MGTVHLHLFPPAGKIPLFLCGQMHATELYLPLFYKFSAFMVYHERDIFYLFLNATVPLDWNGGRYSIFGTQSSDDS